MCTVTVVPRDNGFRLVCNRDERVSRTPALEPQHHAVGSMSAVFPIDPDGGGTWLGLNHTGLVLALLNRTASRRAGLTSTELRSRGLIIPALLRCGSVPEVFQAARELVPTDFAPFQLVAIRDGAVGIITWDGASRTSEHSAATRPLLFTSSSLGAALVDPPRRRLFEASVVNAPDSWLEGQRRFHQHRWPDRPEVSVCMERPGRRTVSRSAIDVTAAASTFEYEPLSARGATAGSTRRRVELRREHPLAPGPVASLSD